MLFSTLITNVISVGNYHHNDGDKGEDVNQVYGGVQGYGSWDGIFYDEDMVSMYHETGSTN